MIDDYLNIKYQLVDSDNFDNFMKALGVGVFLRKMGAITRPVFEITKEYGGKVPMYVMTSKSTFRNFTVKFEPGVAFDFVTPDGRNVKSVIHVRGDCLDEVHTDEKTGEQTSIVRQFECEQLVVLMSFKGVEAKRTYKSVEI